VLAGRSLTRLPACSQRTPPMGWSSWNCFGGAQSQEKMVTVAEAIISLGLRDLVRFFRAILDEFRRVFKSSSGFMLKKGWCRFRADLRRHEWHRDTRTWPLTAGGCGKYTRNAPGACDFPGRI
jgi:hypothetical protein